MKRFVLIAGLFVAAHANASGGGSANFMIYKAYTAPDIAVDRFQEGQLGVLQPGMERVYLFTAWRAMTLGAGIKTSSGVKGGLARANGSAFAYGWEAGGTEKESADAWARETLFAASNFGACPTASNNFALTIIESIRQRKDATAARVKAWVDAQELVSNACKTMDEARYRNAEAASLNVVVPALLDNHEPAYWRQLREYQRAAVLFHAERYRDATAQFSQIGVSAEHPMRDLGHYLALRSELHRAAKQAQKEDQAQRQLAYIAMEKRGQAILADPSLRTRHEATRALLRSARVTLTPEAATAELSKYLADPAADPFADDRLGDWVAAINQARDRADFNAAGVKAVRGQFEFFDWIENLRECGYPENKDKTCRAPAQHALQQWQRTQSRPWLTATMMMSETLSGTMEKAATAVEANDPAYLTVRYHLARLYRLAGRTTEAREVSNAALKLDMSNGSRNLFREERFAVASSTTDAAAYMQRVDVDAPRDSENFVQGLNDDALNWLINGLTTAEMVVIARQPSLDAAIRARLASGAWMRADLLEKYDIAQQALDVLEALAPLMKEEIASYRRAPSAAERRHVMLMTALRYGLSPNMTVRSEPITVVGKDDVTASNWCGFKQDSESAIGPASFPWILPPMPVVGDRQTAKAELDKLVPLKTATGFIGDYVLARVKSQPSDPELPWLLHVVVASTRGGCLDPNAKVLSRAAFDVLHKRYPRDAWTKKTPYFY